MKINKLFNRIHSLMSLKLSISFSESDYRCNSFESALTVGAGWYFFFILTTFHTPTKQQENCSFVYLNLYILHSKLEDKKILH